MKKVILDGVTQEPIDELANRNEEIKRNLEGVLQDFIEEKNMLLAMKKQPKLGGRFMRMIMLELAKYPPMSLDDYVELDYETLNYYYVRFSELICYYNRFFEIVDNKNIFMRYLGVDVDQYMRLEKNSDERIKRIMRMVEGDYVGMGWAWSESGEADVKATTSRLRASGGAGHSVVSAAEEKVIEQNAELSNEDVRKKLRAMGIQMLDEPKEIKG